MEHAWTPYLVAGRAGRLERSADVDVSPSLYDSSHVVSVAAAGRHCLRGRIPKPGADEAELSGATVGQMYIGRSEGPVTALGGTPPSERCRTAAVSQRQWDAAAHRFAVTRYAALLPPSCSLAGRLHYLEQAMEAGLLVKGVIPSREQLRRLLVRWEEGHRSIADYLDGRRRSGVPRRMLHPELQTVVDTATASGAAKRPSGLRRELHETAKGIAVRDGVRPWVPSKDTLRQWLGAGRLLERSAGLHGAAAAQIDALPHSTVPAVLPHDVWTLDEHTSRRWCGIFDHTHPDGQRWVSFKPEVVLIIDNASRVIVGYWVVDPLQRHVPSEPLKLSGFSADDVLAALLAAAIPSLGTAATRRFAGHLPHGQLRWDNALAHRALNERLKRIGIEPPDLPAYRPINRGIVERVGGTLKQWEEDALGYDEAFVPTDRSQQNEDEAQALAASTTARRRLRTAIAPIDLPRIDEFRRDLERVIYRYNYEHHHRALDGRTPAEAYEALYPRRHSADAKRMRAGLDLLALLPAETTVVKREGVVHRGERYAYTVNRKMYMVGTPLTYRADPGGRGLLVEDAGDHVLLPPLMIWASGQTPEQIAETQAGVAELAEARVQAARADREALLVGHHLLGRAKDEAPNRGTAQRPVEGREEAPEDGGGHTRGTAGARDQKRRARPQTTTAEEVDPFTVDLESGIEATAPRVEPAKVRHG